MAFMSCRVCVSRAAGRDMLPASAVAARMACCRRLLGEVNAQGDDQCHGYRGVLCRNGVNACTGGASAVAV